MKARLVCTYRHYNLAIDAIHAEFEPSSEDIRVQVPEDRPVLVLALETFFSVTQG